MMTTGHDDIGEQAVDAGCAADYDALIDALGRALDSDKARRDPATWLQCRLLLSRLQQHSPGKDVVSRATSRAVLGELLVQAVTLADELGDLLVGLKVNDALVDLTGTGVEPPDHLGGRLDGIIRAGGGADRRMTPDRRVLVIMDKRRIDGSNWTHSFPATCRRARGERRTG